MMRYGIPRYRLPRDVLDAEIAAHRRRWASRLELGHPVDRPAADDARRRASTRPSSPSAPSSAAAPTSPPATRRASSTRCRSCAACEDGEPPLLGRRVVGVRRRQHRDGRGPHRPPAGRRPRRWSSTAARATGCPPTTSRSRRRSRRASACAGCPPSRTPTAARSRSRRCELDETGFPQPTGEFEELEADASCSRSARSATCRCWTGAPASRSSTASSQVGADMMTGHPGVFAGGDMVPGRAHRHGRRRPWQDARRRHIDAWLRGSGVAEPPARRAGDLRPAEHLVLRGRAATVRPQLERPAGRPPSTRSSADWTPTPRSSRRAAACPAATASSATTASACARTTRSSSSARGHALRRSTWTTARAAASAPPNAPAARSRWCPSGGSGRMVPQTTAGPRQAGRRYSSAPGRAGAAQLRAALPVTGSCSGSCAGSAVSSVPVRELSSYE